MPKRDESKYPKVRVSPRVRQQLDQVRVRDRLPARYPLGRIVADIVFGRRAPISPPEGRSRPDGHSPA